MRDDDQQSVSMGEPFPGSTLPHRRTRGSRPWLFVENPVGVGLREPVAPQEFHLSDKNVAATNLSPHRTITNDCCLGIHFQPSTSDRLVKLCDLSL